MSAYLPWLILLACPLMMMFMMRGMGGGAMGRRGSASFPPGPDHAERTPRGMTPLVGDERARIAQLEHEVAQLHAARDRGPGGTPASRR